MLARIGTYSPIRNPDQATLPKGRSGENPSKMPIIAEKTPLPNAPTLIKAQGAWKSYSFLDQGKKVCFMSGQPQKQSGKFKKRGEVFFFVTRWMGDKDKNVVSVSNGYAFKPSSAVTARVASWCGLGWRSSARSCSAAYGGRPRSCDQRASSSSVLSPMPRDGTFTTRSNDTLSYGL